MSTEGRKKNSTNNAFQILMSSSRKREDSPQKGIRKNKQQCLTQTDILINSKNGKVERELKMTKASTSKFVLCPICNVNVLESGINLHLDKCMDNSMNRISGNGNGSSNSSSSSSVDYIKDNTTGLFKESPLDPNQSINVTRKVQGGDDDDVTSRATKKSKHDHYQSEGKKENCHNKNRELSELCNVNDNNQPKKVFHDEKRNSSKSGIFDHMMSHSRRLYQKHDSKSYTFHLHDEYGNISWKCHSHDSTVSSNSNKLDSNQNGTIRWKSSVFIKGSSRGSNSSKTSGEKDELIISSSISSVEDTSPVSIGIYIKKSKPLVSNPSKLSVRAKFIILLRVLFCICLQ